MYLNILVMKISEKAKKHAIAAHKAVQHKYDEHEYDHHLGMAVAAFERFKYLIPEKDHDDVEGGIWEHDTVEDCGETFNDLKKVTNERVANIAYACTNEKGRTRAERANNKYYRGIRRTQYATFAKLCDRIANIEYSLSKKSRMFNMYKKEHPHFRSKLDSFYFRLIAKLFRGEPDYTDMWNYIDELLKK